MSSGPGLRVDAGTPGESLITDVRPRRDIGRGDRASSPVGTRLRVVAVVLALVVFVVVGLLGAARDITRYVVYRGFTPIRVPSWIARRATVQGVWVSSPAIGGRSQPVIVVLPPGYAQNPLRRYPVLYLLHGYPELPTVFLNVGQVVAREDILVARRLMRPMILVIPNGTSGFFTDEEWANGIRPGNGWETFVARDLVHAIDRRFRTIPSGAARAIGGLSSGGYGALNIGLHHPGEFRVIESWSGYTHAASEPSVFGTDPTNIAYNSPALYLPVVAPALGATHTFVWFYIGASDGGLPRNEEFASELGRLGIAYRFFTVRARHDWGSWRPNIPKALIAASSHLLLPQTPVATSHQVPKVKLPSPTPRRQLHA